METTTYSRNVLTAQKQPTNREGEVPHKKQSRTRTSLHKKLGRGLAESPSHRDR
jgi:hypothetical protein